MKLFQEAYDLGYWFSILSGLAGAIIFSIILFTSMRIAKRLIKE